MTNRLNLKVEIVHSKGLRMTFNFDQPHNGPELLKYSLKAYICSLPKTAFISALIIVLGVLMVTAPQLAPPAYQSKASLAVMFTAIAILPLLGMIVMLINNHMVQKPASLISLFLYSLERFISLIGSIVSASVLPLLIIMGCILLFFAINLPALKLPTLPLLISFLAPSIMYTLVLLALIPKIFAFVMVFTERLDANESIETSEMMVKGFYWRSFLYTVVAFVKILFIANIPEMAHYYFPVTSQLLPNWSFWVIQAILLLFTIPWVIALWVCHQKDLYSHYLKNSQPAQKSKPYEKVGLKTNIRHEQIKTTSKGGSNDGDNSVGF
ncbi:hypothetical protein CC99x_003895 [Candidatus Berkiella cookevillensis]|uniref:Uncharacterized protein n=1 Tax=Candidatus Berkiella cookevillensis TaxID=437022 RepID=A0A0Q9YAF6_9GAMM|nr:hypothetical protein [Candidatus Berkiella cookevillensis]MCS5708041.1 hypothetical protein [Candidatus Berkiella cookevillensis]